jgi:hypothetical protein
MPRRRLVGPPERATKADAYRVFLGALMVPLGVVILARSLALGVLSPASVIMSVAFVGFGVYRVYVGIVRYRMYHEMVEKRRKGP